MADIAANLFPDSRLLIQGTVYLASLAATHFFFLRPLIALYNERKNRTAGRIDAARMAEARSVEMQTLYDKKLAENLERSRLRRLEEVQQGKDRSCNVIAAAQARGREHLESTHLRLEKNLEEERTKLPLLMEEVVSALFQRLGVSGLLVFGCLSLFAASRALASEGENSFTMDNTGWPYFQFAIYFVVLVYFGKKIISDMLFSKRKAMQEELAAAREAMVQANAKTKAYEEKFANLDKEMDGIFQQYIQDGIREKERILIEAEQIAEQIQRDAERHAQMTIAQAKTELRNELLNLAIETLETRLDAEKLRALEQSFKHDALRGICSLQNGTSLGGVS